MNKLSFQFKGLTIDSSISHYACTKRHSYNGPNLATQLKIIENNCITIPIFHCSLYNFGRLNMNSCESTTLSIFHWLSEQIFQFKNSITILLFSQESKTSPKSKVWVFGFTSQALICFEVWCVHIWYMILDSCLSKMNQKPQSKLDHRKSKP